MIPKSLLKEPSAPPPVLGLALAALACLGTGLFIQTVLESPELSLSFFSEERWARTLSLFGGTITVRNGGPVATVPFAACAGMTLVLGVLVSAILALTSQGTGSFVDRLLTSVTRLGRIWWIAGAWWLMWMIAVLSAWPSLLALVQQSADLTLATCIALTAVQWWPTGTTSTDTVQTAANQPPAAISPNRNARRTLVVGMILYVVVFTAMNWGLWFNLRLPHGDSAMYEEHLWNLEHGKGFRSYLDQGLFLGEHLQVVHILLIPIHLIFPSHLTLELAQSLILALGAWPVFNMARRHSSSEWAAALLGLAYLAYVPLQALDIAIDLKTFRPNSFGIPTLLMALDLLERRRYGWAAFWLAITLSSQEDWAIPIALIGLWLAATALLRKPREQQTESPPAATGGSPNNARRQQLFWGLGLFLFGVAYLWFALNIAIPWFRGGATVHTASYFSKFGGTPREIIVTLLTDWPLVFSTIVTPAALAYAVRLLLPIGFLPLLSPGRLLVAAPLFLLLLMNDLAMQVPAPVHHFHAPLVPVLFWAAAAGLGTRRPASATQS